MKKIKLALALLPLVCLTGCNKEEVWRNDAYSISVYASHQSYNYYTLDYYQEINYILLSTSSIKIKTKLGNKYTINYCSNVGYVIVYK